MVREGRPYIGFGAAVVLAGAGWLLWAPGVFPAALLAVGVVLVGFMAYFFRDPERTVPDVAGAVLAPGGRQDRRDQRRGVVPSHPMERGWR